jgi:O-methyltransferase
MTSTGIPDRELYRPLFSPWLAQGEFQRFYGAATPATLVSPDRCYVLYTMLMQAIHVEGEIWECGVYKGGTAALMAKVLKKHGPWKKLILFDTFEGMPDADPRRDLHRKGDFCDTSLEAVAAYIQEPDLCVFRKGHIPSSFQGLESDKVAFAHIDVDIYRSVLDCLAFI